MVIFYPLCSQASVIDLDIVPDKKRVRFSWLTDKPIGSIPTHVLGFDTHGLHLDINGMPVIKLWKIPGTKALFSSNIFVRSTSVVQPKLVLLWQPISPIEKKFEISANPTTFPGTLIGYEFDDSFDEEFSPADPPGIFSWFGL